MREQMLHDLRQFMIQEIIGMKDNVARNYRANIEIRSRNPFLAFENASTEKFMGLGRSIDSQLGNRMQNIIFYLARIRYSNENTPNIINLKLDPQSRQVLMELYSVRGELKRENYYANANPCKQTVYINKEIDIASARKIMRLRDAAGDIVAKRNYTFPGIVPSYFEYIESLAKDKFPVDLFFVSADTPPHANTFEIKLSGNLDTKNAESNVNEVCRLYKIFSFMNNRSFFASCYGVCSESVRNNIQVHTDCASLLPAADFWATVLPVGEDNLTYEDFIRLYTEVFRESGLENRIISL